MNRELPVVSVLGMHRSGTSAVTGALAAMGIHAGDPGKLLPAHEDNPLGYYERHDVKEANEALLVARLRERLCEELDNDFFETPATLDIYGWLLGAWLPLDERPADAALEGRLRQCLADLRADAGEQAAAVLLKDPRLSLVMPAWRALGGRWLVVLALRQPAAVVSSLARRDRMRPATGEALFRTYLYAAERHSRGLPRIAVDYDRLLAAPAEVLGGLADFLLANGVRLAPRAVERGVAALDPALRRSGDRQPVAEDTLRIYSELAAAVPGVPELSAPPARPDAAGLQRALQVPLVQRALRAHAVAEASRKTMEASVEEMLRHRGALERVVAHPVTGPLIRLLRRLKRDPTFGAP